MVLLRGASAAFRLKTEYQMTTLIKLTHKYE